MKEHHSAILFLGLLLLQSLPLLAGNNDEKLRNIVKINGQAEVTIQRPGRTETDRLSRNVSIIKVSDNKLFISLSSLTVEWFIAQKYEYSIAERDESKGIITSSDVKQALEWNTYPTYTQYDSIMRSFVSEYPALCSLDTIGTSVKGRLVLALKITGNSSADEFKPKVFYTSGIHGNETAGYILMLRLSDSLLKSYSINTQIRTLIDNLEIWINPMANPDGTYRDGNEITNPVRYNANGYDLNRNFPDPEVQDPDRQKETTDMMKFLVKHKFVLSANFHSGEEVVNYPWDHLSSKHADDTWFRTISRAFADTAHVYGPKGYMTYLDKGITNGYAWYPVYGGRQDYVTGTLHGREVTVEIDSNYVCPVSYLPVLWEADRRSLIYYLENALSGIHGKVTDLDNGKPVPAKITITGHDHDNSEVLSDTLTGNYVRLIEPGLWNVTFSAGGYQDTVLSNVAVNEGTTTWLNVIMEPVINPVDTLKPEKPLLFPNPVKTYLMAVLPERLRSHLVIKIFSQTGALLKDYEADASDGSPVTLDIENLGSGVYFVMFKNSTGNLSMTGRFSIIR